MNLGFLNNLNITTIEAAKPAVTKKESNPDPSSLCIRVWKSGEIFPSERLVRDYNLEYPNAIQVENIALFNEDGTPKMVAVEGKEAVQEFISTMAFKIRAAEEADLERRAKEQTMAALKN